MKSIGRERARQLAEIGSLGLINAVFIYVAANFNRFNWGGRYVSTESTDYIGLLCLEAVCSDIC